MQSADSQNSNKLLRFTPFIALCFFFVYCHTNGISQTIHKQPNRNTTNAEPCLIIHFGNTVSAKKNSAVMTASTTSTAAVVFSSLSFALKYTATSPAVDGAAYPGSPSLFEQCLHQLTTSRNPENRTPLHVVLTTNANACLSETLNGIDLTELIGRTAFGSSPMAGERAHCSNFGLTEFSEVGSTHWITHLRYRQNCL